MDTIKVLDKTFKRSITEAELQAQVKRVADEINRDYAGKDVIFLCILNGSFMFAADLLKNISFPCQMAFVKLASYQGTVSTGKIREVIGLTESIKDKHVIIVEDIVDTGFTMANALEILGAREPASLEICSLLLKPTKLKVDLKVKYVAMQIPDDFIVGYGLDYDGFGRNFRDIYTIVQ